MASKVVGASIRAVKKRKLIPTKQAIVLTQAAVRRVKEILQHEPDVLGLKIGVKQRGCNGMSYTLEYVNKKEKFDEEVEQDGVKILIDSKAQMTILGTEMDFVEDKLSSEFVFNNPNIKGTCGCGESFNL
ncbi:iron-sulfur cluster assembly 1 homolog, mitochondrial-like [Styela clava]|uniref:iron-sulfur cluster assembly 1 homolog, mitochondrial-like n=1 Tax=Styela clava TaxID=7725 RepID=UPI00193A663A|nr:iron-sulfur cluster assembly 1 homolog, mitochondrial-like [Styela clava]